MFAHVFIVHYSLQIINESDILCHFNLEHKTSSQTYLLTVYNSLVYCRIFVTVVKYVVNVVKGCLILRKLQNMAARVVPFSDYNRETSELLDELVWDNFRTRRSEQLAMLMYKTME